MSRTHPPKNPGSHFRELLNDNRDMVLVFLNTQLNDLFGSTDEALLDFAEQAESDAVQGRFFEAMGAVRKKRADIEHIFRQAVNDAFDHFGQPRFTADLRGSDDIELSLIEPEEMEESVATENIINRAATNYYTQLYALGQRLAVVNQGRKMEEEDIPGGPTVLVKGYRAALQLLEIDVKAKIVLYALFDKFVMRQLKDMYDEFNSNLKNEGILPNLKPLYTRAGQTESDAPAAAAVNDPEEPAAPADVPPPGTEMAAAHYGEGAPVHGPQSLGEELFDSILELMSHRRQAGQAGSALRAGGAPAHGGQAPAAGHTPPAAGGYAQPSGGGMPAGGGAAAPGAAAADGAAVQQRVISAIDAIRPTSLKQSGGVMSDLENLPNVAVDPGFVDKIKAVVHQEREQIFSEAGGRENMNSIDADTIDLIGMLFEYMLNDPLLPNLAKALLSHLHTPYLKLSLIDRNLLVDSEHPARLLLDSLVEAGGQWVFENDIKRGIFPHMQTVVDRVLKEFRDKVELFSDLLDYFSAAVDEYKRKSDAIEHRAQESVRGKEKLQVAKKRAASEMKSRVRQNRMPKSAGQFLLHTWADRLVFILLRHPEGDQSEEWTRALQAADDLVWLFEPKTTESEREDVVRVCDLLQAEIQAGLETLGGYHQHHVDELFALLRDPETLINWEGDAMVVPYSEPVVPESEPIVPLPSAAAAEQGKPQAAAAHGLSSSPLFFQEGEALPEGEGEGLSDRESDMLEKLQKLKFGTWFEFKGGNGVPPRRLKLSWLSPLTSTCMFVDRSGLQAEIKPLVELSRMLVTGRAKVIPRPKHPFVEGALLAIKRTLQRSVETN